MWSYLHEASSGKRERVTGSRLLRGGQAPLGPKDVRLVRRSPDPARDRRAGLREDVGFTQPLHEAIELNGRELRGHRVSLKPHAVSRRTRALRHRRRRSRAETPTASVPGGTNNDKVLIDKVNLDECPRRDLKGRGGTFCTRARACG